MVSQNAMANRNSGKNGMKDVALSSHMAVAKDKKGASHAGKRKQQSSIGENVQLESMRSKNPGYAPPLATPTSGKFHSTPPVTTNTEQELMETTITNNNNVGSDPVVVRLLATSQDAAILPPLHVWIRQQIQVFTATANDLAQPAPGRKTKIQLGQVGLRCRHCWAASRRCHATTSTATWLSQQRPQKRAVCYPTSVGRVYNSVSDMKYDHFQKKQCPALPPDAKREWERLLAEQEQAVVARGSPSRPSRKRRKTSAALPQISTSTAQYYHDTARAIGLEDSGYGTVVWNFHRKEKEQPPSHHQRTTTGSVTPAKVEEERGEKRLPQPPIAQQSRTSNSAVVLLPGRLSVVRDVPTPCDNTTTTFNIQDATPLATPPDSDHLSPLHCWIRQHIVLVCATPADVAAPCPGRKIRISLGQVGIQCRHCGRSNAGQQQQPKKRTRCYPSSVAGLYHAVSNMKLDHFAAGQCSGVTRHEYQQWAAAVGHRTAGKQASISTAQYYQDSARALGLVDSPTGMRWADGMEALVIAATQHKQTVDSNGQGDQKERD